MGMVDGGRLERRGEEERRSVSVCLSVAAGKKGTNKRRERGSKEKERDKDGGDRFRMGRRVPR